MPLSMYGASVPAFVRTLTALSNVLDKAAAHCAAKKIDPSVLLTARLYPDMFPLARQVQVTSDFAKNTVARLSGVEQPKFPDEEKTFDELRARIAKTLDIVRSMKPQQIDGSEEKEITFPVAGQPTTFKGEAYLVGFALPNFYFHAATAYDILRHNGVELGKRDFMGPR
ncbi:MAG: DUF1993 domain-containing protein [Xanthobacteraceae bacterium]